jgi:hypothetical protein
MLSYTVQQFNKTTTLDIELIDNHFSNKWKDYLTRTLERLPNLSWSPSTHLLFNYSGLNPINHFHKLKQSFELLQEHYGTDYSSEISELLHLIKNPKDLKQSHLNLWGRHYINTSYDFVN